MILPDDGPQVDPPDQPPYEDDGSESGWDYTSIVPSHWRWNDEAVQAYRLQTGWGPK
ncbi:hypothetical protein I6A60_00420 [Frankia sp. AgB1.9]|uniref:hypothetical protein n=1 Tax=unclassified Frankia TaxID=2632575 RepID=UPI00193386B0|nr:MULTISPECIES: hypothetical protein [unclassified Frankia]MBL7546352.1 hypothetical protein [Frankia sp. AgB1.9]